LAKHTHLPFALNEKSCDIPFGLIHMDIWGPYRVCTQNQCRYFLTIVDDCTRATWTYLLKYKSQAFATMQMFYNYALNQFGYAVKIIRSDNALEFDTSECQQFFANQGIVHQTSCVDKPQQNGRVERKHRHLLEISRALRFHAHLPLKFWGDCVLTATYIINRLPTKVLQNVTPYEKLLKKTPSYNHMKVFGCLAFASNPSKTGDKFQPRGVPCVFLGYPATQKGYKLLNLLTDITFVSRDVVFHEHIFPFQHSSLQQYKTPLPAFFPQCLPFADINYEDDTAVPLAETEQIEQLPAQPDRSIPQTSAPAAEISGSPTDSTADPPPQQVRTSTRVSKKPGWLQDYVTMTAVQTSYSDDLPYESICPEYSAYLAATARSGDPSSFATAVKEELWCDAMNMELRALEDNKTWLLTPLPLGKKAIGCKWIFRTKFKSDGSVDKLKARLVAQGYSQQFGIDYDETFAPVAKMTTVRTLLTVAAIKQWCVNQMDVSNAFLHGDLQEEVYMALPQGYTSYGCKITPQYAETEGVIRPKPGDMVCKLVKALYGLKQAPRQWFTKLTSALLAYGFQQSKADYTLFTKNCKNGDFLVILIYVDDMILAATNEGAMVKLKTYLHSKFHMKDMGVLSYFLGLEITSSSTGFFLCQRKYIQDLLVDMHMEYSKPLQLPLGSHIKLTQFAGKPLSSPDIFRRLVGKLIYLTITRPDIAFAVQVLS